MSEIPYNLAAIHKRMELACKNANRDTAVVKLLLATKTISAEKIKIALGAGETLIGENKVQELKEKFDELKKIRTKHILLVIYNPIRLKKF